MAEQDSGRPYDPLVDAQERIARALAKAGYSDDKKLLVDALRGTFEAARQERNGVGMAVTVSVNLDATEFGTWDKWRVNAFFKGLEKIAELVRSANADEQESPPATPTSSKGEGR